MSLKDPSQHLMSADLHSKIDNLNTVLDNTNLTLEQQADYVLPVIKQLNQERPIREQGLNTTVGQFYNKATQFYGKMYSKDRDYF